MTLLAIIGFIVICIIALYLTFVSIVLIYCHAAFDSGMITPVVMAAIAGGLWALAWHLSPFTITIGTV